MSYQVRIARDAERDIASLHSAVVPRIFKAIKALGTEPRPKGCKKLKGAHSESWRIRVGAYRILMSSMTASASWKYAKWDIGRTSTAEKTVRRTTAQPYYFPNTSSRCHARYSGLGAGGFARLRLRREWSVAGPPYGGLGSAGPRSRERSGP